MTQKIELKASYNNVTCQEPCRICGIWDKFADVPFWIFHNGGPVCPTCVEKYEPDLLEIVQHANLLHHTGYLLMERIKGTDRKYTKTERIKNRKYTKLEQEDTFPF